MPSKKPYCPHSIAKSSLAIVPELDYLLLKNTITLILFFLLRLQA